MRYGLFFSAITILTISVNFCSPSARAQETDAKSAEDSSQKSSFDPADLDSIVKFDWQELSEGGATYREIQKELGDRAKAAMAIAEANSGTAIEKQALKFICSNPIYSDIGFKAAKLYEERYMMDADTGDVLGFLFSEETLTKIEKEHPTKKARVVASFVLANKQLDELPMWQGWTEDDLPGLKKIQEKFTMVSKNGEGIMHQGLPLVDQANHFLAQAKTQFPGTKMIELEGESVKGESMTLSEHKGKVVMISCWASWCKPCRMMFPHERAIVERYADEPFVLLGINGDESRESAMKLIDDGSVTWDSYWLGEQMGDHPIMNSLAIDAWPTVLILDQEGVVRFVNPRNEEDDAIEKAIDSLLTKSKETE